MGLPTHLDTVILAPAAILGLLGVWLGFGRSLVAWPMRWLIPLLGAGAVALPAALYLAVSGELATFISLDAAVAAAASLAASAATLVLLVMFMRNLRERMAAWTRGRGVGLMERVGGALAGIACGLLLAAVPLSLHEAIQPMGNGDRGWAHDSVLLPYFRSAAADVRSTLLQTLPPATGRPRRER